MVLSECSGAARRGTAKPIKQRQSNNTAWHNTPDNGVSLHKTAHHSTTHNTTAEHQIAQHNLTPLVTIQRSALLCRRVSFCVGNVPWVSLGCIFPAPQLQIVAVEPGYAGTRLYYTDIDPTEVYGEDAIHRNAMLGARTTIIDYYY
eukprot:gene11251-biopygen8728